MEEKTSILNQDSEQNPKQDIFVEPNLSQINAFQEACNDPEVIIAIGIIVKEGMESPIVWFKGHQYNIASLLASILKDMRAELIDNISV